MNKYRELQIYLIRRFLLLMIMVSAMEYGIVRLLSHTILPFILNVFFDGASLNYLENLGFGITALCMFIAILFTLIIFVLPDSLRTPFNSAVDYISRRISITTKGGQSLLPKLDPNDLLLLLVLIIAVLICLIIPYVLGAIVYSHIVVRELHKIEEEEMELHKEYDQKRNLMLSDIAHDLRTPMTTVSGYSKALTDNMVPDSKKEEYLEAIQRKSKRVNDLITLLFDYVKLDTEGFKLMKQEVDLAELVREAGAFVYQDVEDADMTFDADIVEERVPVQLDRLQMSRVITNLLTNAIKHNKAGTRVGLFLYQEDDYIRVLVADSGDKIDKENAEHIFEPFVMGDESRSSKGGTGLGLSIAKKVVEMHGFTIRLVQGSRLAKYKFVGDYEKAFIISIKK